MPTMRFVLVFASQIIQKLKQDYISTNLHVSTTRRTRNLTMQHRIPRTKRIVLFIRQGRGVLLAAESERME